MRRHLFVQKTVTIDAVDGVGAQSAVFDERLDCVNEIETFVFEEVGGCGGKHEQRRPRVTVSDEGHFHVQVRAIPCSCATFHQGTFHEGGSGLEIFSQIVAMRKFGAVDGRIPICYKKRFAPERSEEHTSELQSHSFISYAF